MPPEQTPVPQPEPFNFLKTDPKKNFAPWFLIFCAVLIIVGLGITAYFKYQAYQSYKAGIETTEQLSSHDPTSDWQTYRNEEYGFEFKYPNDWNYRTYGNTITISSTTTKPQWEDEPGNEIGITVLSIGSNSDLNSWIQDWYIDLIDWSKTSILYYTNPQNIEFSKLENVPGFSSDNIEAYILINSDVIVISVSPASIYGSIFNNILATFKIIEPTKKDERVFCTADAMMCPDGSYVSRTGQNCEFVCP